MDLQEIGCEGVGWVPVIGRRGNLAVCLGQSNERVISGFRRGFHENCTLLGFHAVNSGNSLPISCPEASVRNYPLR